MDRLHNGQNFKNFEIVKLITTALKSMLKLVKLQYFTTKLCNFTKFKMLFNAVVMNFTISTFFKILSIMQSADWTKMNAVVLGRIPDRLRGARSKTF